MTDPAVIGPDAVKKVARAIRDYLAWGPDKDEAVASATAAIAALTGRV